MDGKRKEVTAMAELKPCPFCGHPPKLEVKKEIRTTIRCSNPQCYLAYVSPTSWNNGDTDEHALQRVTTWWNRRAENG